MKLKYILLSKRSQSKRLHTIGSQLYDMLKKAKQQQKKLVVVKSSKGGKNAMNRRNTEHF